MDDETQYTVTDDKPDLLRIDQVWVFVAQDDAGNEGVCAFNAGNLGWLPMVAADEKRVASLRETAAQMAKTSGDKIVLCKFSVRDEVETFDG